MVAPRCISMFLRERAAASKRYQYATASERKCTADIFLRWRLLLETFQCVLKNVRLLLKRFKKNCATASEKINVQLLLSIMST